MSRRVLALFAKVPLPGLVKTRLTTTFSPEQAAELYESMLLDILDQHVSDDWEDCDLALWYTPAEAEDWFRAHAPAGYALRLQRGPDLAARMAALFREHAAEGYDRIVLRGTDSPTLPRARVRAAFEALERADLALCPDRDGGYNLIALRAPCDALFELEMSQASLVEQTLARARELGLRSATLLAHHDVDEPGDLELLRAESLKQAPRTAAWLRREGRLVQS